MSFEARPTSTKDPKTDNTSKGLWRRRMMVIIREREYQKAPEKDEGSESDGGVEFGAVEGVCTDETCLSRSSMSADGRYSGWT